MNIDVFLRQVENGETMSLKRDPEDMFILAFECIRLRTENAMLTEQLAQERKRLDWALKNGAQKQGKYFVYGIWDKYVKTENPRATIDELIASEKTSEQSSVAAEAAGSPLTGTDKSGGGK